MISPSFIDAICNSKIGSASPSSNGIRTGGIGVAQAIQQVKKYTLDELIESDLEQSEEVSWGKPEGKSFPKKPIMHTNVHNSRQLYTAKLM